MLANKRLHISIKDIDDKSVFLLLTLLALIAIERNFLSMHDIQY